MSTGRMPSVKKTPDRYSISAPTALAYLQPSQLLHKVRTPSPNPEQQKAGFLAFFELDKRICSRCVLSVYPKFV